MSADVTDLPPEDEYLSQEEVMHLRQALRDQAKLLIDRSRDNIGDLTEEQNHDGDQVDVAANESERGHRLRFADRERKMLGKIQMALERISEGEYGVCEGCGEAIGYKRLLARPVATLCIDCKTQAEQHERRSWGS
ncbi:MAG: RNA polymerase-binding protein DksA [Myxococcota bacterium]|nr:RNA polymerase-binding protein DksA [Myxococcota bacterium]